MSPSIKTLLLSAGLALLVLALGMAAFGIFFPAPRIAGPVSQGRDNNLPESGRYTAALKIESNSNTAAPSRSPTPTPRRTPNDTNTSNSKNSYTSYNSNTSINAPYNSKPPYNSNTSNSNTFTLDPTPTPQPLPTPTGTVPPSDPIGNACKFTAGPRAGQTKVYPPDLPAFLLIGSPCSEGASSGTIIKVKPIPIPTPKRSPTPKRNPNTNATPGETGENFRSADTEDYSYRYASAVEPATESLPPAVPAPPEKDNVDICYPVSMYTGEGKSVILRLIRALEPSIDDFCPSTVNTKKDVKRSLAMPDVAGTSSAHKLLKDFCAAKGANYEPLVFAKLNSSTFKIITDEARQSQSLLEPRQEWDFNIKAEGDVLGEQELSFSLRVDCVNKQDKNDVVHFPLPSSPSFKIDVQKTSGPWIELGTINIAGLVSGLLGSILCVPFISDRIKSLRQRFAARDEKDTKASSTKRRNK